MLDVVISGGGYVGLSLAVAIKKARPNLTVCIIEAAATGSWQKDGRASAIAKAAVHMLEVLGVWDEVLPQAEAITRMIITDSNTSDPVRPVFLTFDEDVNDGEPFAYMVPNPAMVGPLLNRAQSLGIELRYGAKVTGFERDDGGIDAHLSSGEMLRARLLVACDGAKSKLRDLAGIKTVSWDYGQMGIVTTVEHERPHFGTAEEHFLPSGPFAILPLKNNRSSLVWTERSEDAGRLVSSDDLVFEAELIRRFGHKLGDVKVVADRHAFPLGLTLARSFIAPRIALAGDAAHRIHPISGQGLNFGFKDVAALAETIIDADRLGLDFGSMAVLERYQAWRRFDTFAIGVTTDVLNRLFSNDITPVRALRDFGLGVVERLPTLKSFFMRQAAGSSDPANPKLLNGILP